MDSFDTTPSDSTLEPDPYTHASVVIVGKIETSAPGDFEDRLLSQLGVSEVESFCEVVATVRAHGESLPLDFSRPTGGTSSQTRLIETRIACGVRELNQTCPLLSDEEESAAIQSGLLTGAWQHLPEGTPVIKRTTNFSTVYMAWPEYTVVDNEIVEPPRKVHLKAGAPNPCWTWDRPIPDDTNSKLIFNTIITVLSSALNYSGYGFLSPFLGLFGSQVSKPLSLKDTFQIATCAAEKVAKAQVIESIKGSLSEMDRELQDTYLPAKKLIEGTNGSDRIARMQHAESIGVSILTAQRDNLGALESADLDFDGLVPYVITASAVLSLYQELSTVDHSAATPAESSYITSMKSFAVEAADHVEKTAGAIKSKRHSAIVLTTHVGDISRCSFGPSPTCVTVGRKVIGASWEDQISGDYSGKKKYVCNASYSDEAIQGYIRKCEDEMNAHSNAVMHALDLRLKPLLDAAITFKAIPAPTMSK